MANEIDVTVESVEHVINVSVTGSGPVGEKGDKGDRGERGYDGTAATIRVGNVITNQSEQLARVENVGTPTNAIFDFYLPRGPQGIQGLRGETGRDGIDGYTPVKGEDYWTPADKEEIVTETVGSVQPSVTELANEVDALSQEVSNKMEFYKVVLDGNPLSFKHDGVVVNYAQLADKYRDDKYFLFAEYENVTFIPSLPPDDDPMHDENVLEFTAVWKYSGAMHITSIKINELEQIKVEEFEAVGDVTINGASIVDGGVAAVPIANATNKLGLIQGGWYKFIVDANGRPQCYAMTRKEEYVPESNYMFVSKGTLNTVLANPSIMPALTESEKAAARARMGLGDDFTTLLSVTLSEAVGSVSVLMNEEYRELIVAINDDRTIDIPSFNLYYSISNADASNMSSYMAHGTGTAGQKKSIFDRIIRNPQFDTLLSATNISSVHFAATSYVLNRKHMDVKGKLFNIRGDWNASINIPAGTKIEIFGRL